MRSRVRKWGNSLALRLPKPFATELRLEQESVVELTLVDGKLIIEPATKAEITLESLLGGVTAENVHREVDTGRAVGAEAW